MLLSARVFRIDYARGNLRKLLPRYRAISIIITALRRFEVSLEIVIVIFIHLRVSIYCSPIFFFHFPELGRHIFNCNPYLTLLTIYFLSPPVLQLR